MSKLVQNFIGVDISKKVFDVALLVNADLTRVVHEQFEQCEKGFACMQSWLLQHGVTIGEHTLFCMENTGVYNYRLIEFLNSQKAQVWVEMAIRIKRSQGFERASNDKTDAIKIAQYAFRHQDKIKLWTPSDEHLAQIKNLITQRDRIVGCLTRLTVPVEELKQAGCVAMARQMEALQKTAIKNLEKAKDKIEVAIQKQIAADAAFVHKVQRITSINGIGTVTATAFLVYTNGFTTFTSGKEIACYCGVAPFIKKQSGTSIKSKSKISPFANKKLKTLIHMCAVSAIQHDAELKAYYERQVQQGKPKMSVMNAVRNKLILRMFAVVRDDRDFVENYKKACA